MKRALITGISGQDGSYLAEYLLQLGYEVYGLVRREPQSMRPSLRTHLMAPPRWRLIVFWPSIAVEDYSRSAAFSSTTSLPAAAQKWLRAKLPWRLPAGCMAIAPS